jgi:succinate-acetate transporter protein
VSYGAYWLTYAHINQFWTPTGYASAQDIQSAIGIYALSWTIFSGYMMVASLRTSWAVFAVFFFQQFSFALHTASYFNPDLTAKHNLLKAGGWFGIITAFAAWVRHVM